MSLISIVFIYAIIWWLVLFMVLPFGVRTVKEDGGELEEGLASSAPVRPRIAMKMLITTGISAAVMAVIVGVVEAELIDFRSYFEPPR